MKITAITLMALCVIFFSAGVSATVLLEDKQEFSYTASAEKAAGGVPRLEDVSEALDRTSKKIGLIHQAFVEMNQHSPLPKIGNLAWNLLKTVLRETVFWRAYVDVKRDHQLREKR